MGKSPTAVDLDISSMKIAENSSVTIVSATVSVKSFILALSSVPRVVISIFKSISRAASMTSCETIFAVISMPLIVTVNLLVSSLVSFTRAV